MQQRQVAVHTPADASHHHHHQQLLLLLPSKGGPVEQYKSTAAISTCGSSPVCLLLPVPLVTLIYPSPLELPSHQVPTALAAAAADPPSLSCSAPLPPPGLLPGRWRCWSARLPLRRWSWRCRATRMLHVPALRCCRRCRAWWS